MRLIVPQVTLLLTLTLFALSACGDGDSSPDDASQAAPNNAAPIDAGGGGDDTGLAMDVDEVDAATPQDADLADDVEDDPADEDTPGAQDVEDEPEAEDAGEADAAADVGEEDGGEEPGEPPLDGFGALSGTCGALEVMDLESDAPALLINRLDFADDPYDEDEDQGRLSDGGQRIAESTNAGGSSLLSEVFAYEVLHRCELASLLKTELEIEYLDEMGKITDMLVEIDGLKIGVSVTRAVTFPRDADYPVAQAADLLERKLQGVLDSTANVSPGDAWTKQILHIIAYGDAQATSMEAAFDLMPPEVLDDTIVFITVSDGADDFLY